MRPRRGAAATGPWPTWSSRPPRASSTYSPRRTRCAPTSPGPDYAAGSSRPSSTAEQGWAAAVEAAERERDARRTPAQRRLISQVRTLLGVGRLRRAWSRRGGGRPARQAQRRVSPSWSGAAGGSDTAAGGHGPGTPGAPAHAGRRGRPTAEVADADVAPLIRDEDEGGARPAGEAWVNATPRLAELASKRSPTLPASAPGGRCAGRGDRPRRCSRRLQRTGAGDRQTSGVSAWAGHR